jgi:hypothetical protein
MQKSDARAKSKSKRQKQEVKVLNFLFHAVHQYSLIES